MTEEVEVKEMIKKKDMESNLRQGRRLVTNEKVNSRLMDLLFYEVEELWQKWSNASEPEVKRAIGLNVRGL